MVNSKVKQSMREVVQSLVASKLSALLVLRDETYQGLAAKSGVSHGTIWRAAHGTGAISFEIAVLLANSLNCKVSELVGSR